MCECGECVNHQVNRLTSTYSKRSTNYLHIIIMCTLDIVHLSLHEECTLPVSPPPLFSPPSLPPPLPLSPSHIFRVSSDCCVPTLQLYPWRQLTNNQNGPIVARQVQVTASGWPGSSSEGGRVSLEERVEEWNLDKIKPGIYS